MTKLFKNLGTNLGTIQVFKRLLPILTFFMLSVQVFAHGDLSMRIAEKTVAISENPDNAELYYERGLLYQQHTEYSNALEDYHKSQVLGNTNKALHYRIAEVHYVTEDFKKALKSIGSYLELDSIDVKGKKLEAQIWYNLGAYKESLKAYHYVMETMVDIRPEDILEFADIILAENKNNYNDALEAIEFGLDQLGPNTLSLQLKKLDYLEDSDQREKALEHYNYFIVEYKRKEFWYYRKAEYLAKMDRPQESNISLKLATATIGQLDDRFKNMSSIIKLKEQIKSLESLNNQRL